MNCGETGLILLLGGVFLTAPLQAVVTNPKDNPYNVIVERNVFGLKAPEVIPTNPPPVITPATKVTLSGITSIISPKRAILQWGEPPKPGTPPGKEESYIMAEGDRKGIIEVLEIDEKAGRVKIKNADETMVLTFELNGAKLTTTPLPTPPGTSPHPTAAIPAVAPINRFANNPNPAAGATTLANNNIPSIPPRQLRATPTAPDAAVAVQQPAMTPETQVVLMEIERERTKEAVAAGELPPLPPTELTPLIDSAPPGPGGPPAPQ